MSDHPIRYREPASRAFAGMEHVLFRPFRISKWFALGFTAFLAGLANGGGGGGAGGSHFRSGGGQASGMSGPDPSLKEVFAPALAWIAAHWLLVTLLILLIVTFGFALLWLSSRGKFMFLDNVVHNRALVKVPWAEFRDQGNSLFLWRLFFSLATFLAILVLGGAMIAVVVLPEWRTLMGSTLATVAPFVILLLGMVFLVAYINLLVEDFVVPLMYRHRLTTLETWKRFLVIHNASPFTFVGFALWKALLWIAAAFIFITAILLTCGCAVVILILPYLGSVLALPALVFFRFLGPLFLRQFGPEYDLWAPPPSLAEPEGIA